MVLQVAAKDIGQLTDFETMAQRAPRAGRSSLAAPARHHAGNDGNHT